jgi:hypothetical protein
MNSDPSLHIEVSQGSLVSHDPDKNPKPKGALQTSSVDTSLDVCYPETRNCPNGWVIRP